MDCSQKEKAQVRAEHRYFERLAERVPARVLRGKRKTQGLCPLVVTSRVRILVADFLSLH